MANNYDKYQKLKLQYTYGPGDGYWIDVEPPRYKAGELIEKNSPDCGGVNRLYRWYALSNDYICQGYNKYYKEVYQVSMNNGLTWENVKPLQTRTGQLMEANSMDCSYGITWELVPDEYICEMTGDSYDNNYNYILYYDKINNKLTFRNSDAQSIKDDYMSGNYTPIGISVVPFGHNLYGDNSCGVASLHIFGKGGYYHVSKPSVTEIMGMGFTIYNGFLNGNNENGTGEPSPFNPSYGDKTTRRIDYGRIAYDYFTSIQCKHNPNKYYTTYESNDSPPFPLCPSVFLADGSKNTNAFLSFKPDKETFNNLMINSIADTDGRYNTYKILEPMPEKKPADGKPYSYLISNVINYSTDGTQQRDWYVPSAAEGAYFISNYENIQSIIRDLYSYYQDDKYITEDKYQVTLLSTLTYRGYNGVSSAEVNMCMAMLDEGIIYNVADEYDASRRLIPFIRVKSDFTIVRD